MKNILTFLVLLLVCGTVASGQITIVGAVTDSTGNGNNHTIALNTTGATLLVAVCSSANAGSVSDTYANTWIASTTYGPSNSMETLYYAYSKSGSALATGTADVLTCASAQASPFLLAVKGTLTTSAVLDGAVVGSTAAAPGSITPSQSGDLFVYGLTNASQAAATCGGASGFSALSDPDDGSGDNEDGCMFYQIESGASALNPTGTLVGDSGAWGSVMAAFKQAGGGGTLNTRTDADSLSLADAISNHKTKPRTDSDSATFADSIARVATHPRTSSDGASVSDSLSEAATKIRTLVQRVGERRPALPATGRF